jgi:hypothetical protein
MINVLSRAARATFELDPFPHMLIDDALDADVYGDLTAHYPSLDVINRRGGGLKNNHLYLLSARDVDAHPRISEDWKAFFRFHVSAAFWLSALPLLRTQLLAIHPTLEALAGKPLEDFGVIVRDHDGAFDEDISLDCQFGANSPVTRASSVRSPHLDRPSKLFNALLYCRAPDDDTPGGELVLYRPVAPLLYSDGSSVLPTRVVPVKRIAYRANRLVLFLNSPRAVHGVAPRPRTPHVRRYINFLCEFRESLFDVERAPPLTRAFEGMLAAMRPRATAVETV